ncbi:MAG TPA: TonB-dependent receptor [Nevskiaceae bacterium]|nr:TonB-dependent receptor [Nevskiaceae bacterium]
MKARFEVVALALLPIVTAAALAEGEEAAPVVLVDAPEAEASPETDAPARPRVGLSIGEIVVTAQKREEAANSVPIAISAFKGEDLKALGITDTRNLSSIVPGFTAADNGYNTPVYTLRGIGYNDTTYTATSTVGVYLDEINMPYGVMTKGANLDLQRVEVLKGPQGTLYGRNTTGGAINYIANKPTDTFESGITASYGNYQTGELEGFVSGPLSDDVKGRLAARTVASGKGWQHSNTRYDHLGKQKKASARGQLEWEPGHDWTLRFVADGWIDKSDAQGAQAIAIRAQNPFVPSTPTPVLEIPVLGPILSPLISGNLSLSPQVRQYPYVDPDTDDHTVADWPYGAGPTGNTYNNPHGIGGKEWVLDDHYWRTGVTAKSVLDESTNLTVIAAYGSVTSDGSRIPNSGLDVSNTEQEIDANIKTTSLEIRLDGTLGEAWKWLAGINGSYDDGYEEHHVWVPTVSAVFPDPVTGTSAITTEGLGRGDTTAQALGVFTKWDWQFAETLEASLGIRYSNEHREFRGCFSEPVTSQGLGFQLLIGSVSAALFQTVNLPPKGTCINLDDNGQSGPYHGALSEDNVSGRGALTWTPRDGMLWYLAYSRGFKSGGFPVANSSYQKQYEPTKQEKLLAWEVGGKITWIESVLHTNVAIFDYDYTDKQLLSYFKDPVFGVLPILVNVPESTVYGAELDLQWTPLDGLFLSLAGSYIDTRVDRYTGLNADGDEQDFEGRPFNFTPKWQGTALADYTVPLSDRYRAGAGVDYTYTSTTNATFEGDPLYELRSNGMLGARLRFENTNAGWQVQLWGRNLTDEFAAKGIFRTGDAVARTTAWPRTYGISLTYTGF